MPANAHGAGKTTVRILVTLLRQTGVPRWRAASTARASHSTVRRLIGYVGPEQAISAHAKHPPTTHRAARYARLG